MELYLIKSTALLAIFFVGYKIFLERENMHVFKRFYLLGSVLSALLIPFITFTQYVEIVPVVFESSELVASDSFISGVTEVAEVAVASTPINYWPYIIWSLYALGVLFFSIRFATNLFRFYQRISTNEQVKQHGLWYILLHAKSTPHTFFHYIFLHKETFQKGEIPNEVLIHEHAHALQKHTIDLLAMELLQIVLWFNPLVYFLKKSIKLNHEFLADEAVLQSGTQLASYQNILLDFSSTSSVPAMAHSLNYSSLKKRFTVMKTNTSKRGTWLRSMLVLPLLAVLIYGFSTTQTIERISSESKVKVENPEVQKEFDEWYNNATKSNIETFTIAEDIQINVLEDQSLLVNGLPATLETLPQILRQFNTHLTKKERKENIVASLNASAKIQMGFVNDIKEVLFEYGLKRMKIPNGVLMEDGGTGENITLIFNDEASTNKKDRLTARSISIEILDQNYMVVDGVKIRKENLYSALGSIHTDITKVQRDRIMNIHVSGEAEIAYSDLVFIQKVATTYGYHRIVTPKEEIIRSKKNTPAAPEVEAVTHQEYAMEYLSGAARNGKKAFVLQIELSEIKLNGIPVTLNTLASKLDAHTKDWEETDYTNAHPSILIASTPKAFLKKVNAEFKKTHYSKANSGMSIGASKQELSQKKATAAQLAEYNKLAKKYNEMSKDYMVIKGKELTRMSYLYDLMTVAQRKNAEPYPNIPPPPPAPDAPKAPKVIKGVKYDSPPPPPPPAPAPIVKIGEISDIPPPPSPPNPLDHVIQMAKQGADFYYEGKRISSDKAIELLKKNKGLNIQIKDHKTPNEVRITKKPIKLSKQTAAAPASKINLATGNIEINGEEHFYAKKNGVTSYFNKSGEAVDKNGRLLSVNDQKNPEFYYRGKKISSAKAHELLDNGSARIMTSDNDENGSYTVLLNDLDNPNSDNFKNVNFNDNKVNNPNSVIDLTEVISKGAKFYLNDKKISTEKAKYLAEHTDDIARVNVKEKKGGSPLVYFWTK